MDQTRPHACHLVSDHARPDATAADGHAALDISASDCACQRHDKIRIIVIQIQSAVAEVNYLMAGRAQLSDELFLQFKSAMVGGDADALARSRQ
jgi:hypothetical protein